jgi:hypothetical protein
MISSSFITIAGTAAVVLVLIGFVTHLRGATAGRRDGAIAISVLTASALLHILRPNVPCDRLDETPCH